jgi:hypothetical protein
MRNSVEAAVAAFGRRAERGRDSRPLSAVSGKRPARLGRPVDSLFEARAADDLFAIAEAEAHSRLAVLVPELRDTVVELAKLVCEDVVMSG